VCGLDSSGSRAIVADFCEHGDGHSGFMKCLDRLSFLKRTALHGVNYLVRQSGRNYVL
jgi:hypothetical protein